MLYEELERLFASTITLEGNFFGHSESVASQIGDKGLVIDLELTLLIIVQMLDSTRGLGRTKYAQRWV